MSEERRIARMHNEGLARMAVSCVRPAARVCIVHSASTTAVSEVGSGSACLYVLQRILQRRATVRQRHQDVPQRKLAAPASRQDVVCDSA